MKLSSVFLIISCVWTSCAWGQSAAGFHDKIDTEIEKKQQRIDRAQASVERVEEKISAGNQKVEEIQSEIKKFKSLRERKESWIPQFEKEVKVLRENLGWPKKVVAKKGRYYKCALEKIEQKVSALECEKKFKGLDLAPEVRQKFSDYNDSASLSDHMAKAKEKRLQNKLKRADEELERAIERGKQDKRNLLYWKDKVSEDKEKKLAYQEFAANKHQYKCSPQSKTLDLEQDGVFSNLGRDHQNGLGTCFANTAKNLLYAVTDGKENASFLDIALQYKGDSAVNIDGGGSCAALENIKTNGYCPKEFSPIESGDSSQLKGLMTSSSSLRHQASMLRKLESFLEAKDQLAASDTKTSKAFLKRAPQIIKALQVNALIELPYPSIKKEIVRKWKVKEYYHWGLPKKDKSNISFKDFQEEFERSWQAFETRLPGTLKKDGGLEALRALMDETLVPFFKKYSMNDWRERVLPPNFESLLREFDTDAYALKIKATENFYREIAQLSQDFKLEDFLNPACHSDGKKILKFGGALEDLVSHIKDSGLDPQSLLKGEAIKSNKDLIQLAIAPNCLNKDNRKSIKTSFRCEAFNLSTRSNEFGAGKVSMARFKIMNQLKKGLPVGNSFKSSTSYHINTIVGFRYNPKIQKCEYKIRESQTATSFWRPEEKIANKMLRMTIVDKE